MKEINEICIGDKQKNYSSKKNFFANKILKLTIALALFLIAAFLISGAGVTVENGALNVSNSLTVNASTLFVDSANSRVGIGTTNPTARLSVQGGSITTSGQLTVDDDASGDAQINWINTGMRIFRSGDVFQFDNTVTNKIFAFTGGNLGIGTISPTRTLFVSGNANITGNLAYGSLTQNSPNLIWTEKAFVTCAKAIDGRWYVEYVDANLNTVREWVNSTNPAWQHRECYEKIQTTTYYFSLNLNSSLMPKPENLYFDWNDMQVHEKLPMNQTV